MHCGHQHSERRGRREWFFSSDEGRGGGGGGPFGGGPFGRHRGGPFGGGRGRRLFDPGALRLVVLGLIAEEPRHGYDIIKALEAKFEGAYSPSPGSIYPMLQMLEEADLVVSEANGNKKRYSITDAGRDYVAENADELSKINAQIAESSEGASLGALMHEAKAIGFELMGRLKRGGLNSEQAAKAREILKRARRELEDL